MAGKDDKNTEEEDLIPTGPGADEPEGEKEEKPEEKEKSKAKESEEDEDDEDEKEEGEEEPEARLGHSEDGDERESRRAERKRRKAAQREARDRNQLELRYLRGRNEQLERRFSQLEGRVVNTEAASVDGRIAAMKQQIRVADQVISKAIEAQKGDDVVQAQAIRDELRDGLQKLTHLKEKLTAQAEEGSGEEEGEQEQPTRPPLKPAVLRLAKEWVSDKPWFKPGSQTKEGKQITAIENELIAEGSNPATREHWDELTERVKDALPHRFDEEEEEEDDPPPSKKDKKSAGGPKFSTGGRERPLKRGEVYVSQDRRQALEELGAWEDPVLRKRYLKAFSKYDREKQNSQSNA